MKHESDEKDKLEIFDGKYTFEDIYNKPFIPKELLDTIRKADILLLPYEGFSQRDDYLFPEETYKFYEYFAEQVKDKGLNIEICSSDDDYKELELHADVVNITHIIVKSAVFSITYSIIASFLYDKLKQYNKKDINANVNITIEKNGKSNMICYEGSIENFERAMKSVDEDIFK